MRAGIVLVYLLIHLCLINALFELKGPEVNGDGSGILKGSWPLNHNPRALCAKFIGSADEAKCAALAGDFLAALDQSRVLEGRSVAEQLKGLLPSLLGPGPSAPPPNGRDNNRCVALRVARTSEPGSLPASFTVALTENDTSPCGGNKEVASNTFVAGGLVWSLSIVPHSAAAALCKECAWWDLGCRTAGSCQPGELFLRPASGGRGWWATGQDWVAVAAVLGSNSSSTAATKLSAGPWGSLRLGLRSFADDSELRQLNDSPTTPLVVGPVGPHWVSDTWDARVGRAVAVTARAQLFLEWLRMRSGAAASDHLDTPLPASVPPSAPASPSLHIHYSPEVGAWPYASLVTPNRTFLYPLVTDEDLLWLAADTAQYNIRGELPATQLSLCWLARFGAAVGSRHPVWQLCRAEAAILRAATDSAAAGERVVLAARMDRSHADHLEVGFVALLGVLALVILVLCSCLLAVCVLRLAAYLLGLVAAFLRWLCTCFCGCCRPRPRRPRRRSSPARMARRQAPETPFDLEALLALPSQDWVPPPPPPRYGGAPAPVLEPLLQQQVPRAHVPRPPPSRQGEQRGAARQGNRCEGGAAAQGACIVCMERPVECGLQHGETVHAHFCRVCAESIFRARGRCPSCRAPVERVVRIFGS